MATNCFLKTFSHEDGNVDLSRDLKGFREVFRLLTGNRIDAFFNDCWEKNPVHFRSDGDSHKLIDSNVFSRKKLMEIIENNQLPLDTNLSAVKYTGNCRKSWAFDSEVANTKEVAEAFRKLQTVQFFQPQRFSDDLHRINAGFEFIFGSLAGASAYLTPANSQGLAPHHDDVDVFVLQCEGSKVWNLWGNDMSLPEHHSSDIPRHSLPGPGTEVLMKAGDMLYLPRGTIHEALAQSKFSTHITISVYQHYNMKKLLSNVVPRLIESAFNKNYEMRKGLPVWLSDKLGSLVGLEVNREEEQTTACSANDADRAKDRSAWRNALVLQIKDLVQSLSSEVCLALIDEAADEITGDFVMNRLPPPDIPAKDDFEDSHNNDSRQPHMGTSKAKAPEIKAETVIRMCDTRSMFCMVKELNGVSLLAMAHNKDNSRVTHMGHPDYRHFGDSEDGSDGEEEGEEGNDSQNESDGESTAEDDFGDGEIPFQWSTCLPIRLAPVVLVLKQSACSSSSCTSSFSSTGIALSALQEAVKGDRIRPDEVIDVVHQLRDRGFVEVEVEVKNDHIRAMETERKSKVPVSAAGKSKRSKVTENQESGDPSSGGKQKVSKKEVVNATEKRSRKELEGEDEYSRDAPSRVGCIKGAINRFYENTKKVKRKRLRA